MLTLARGTARMALVESFLVVENDPEVAEYFCTELTAEGAPAKKAATISEGWQEVNGLLEQGVQRLVILLDLMFENHDTGEGLGFLRDLSKLSQFKERISVIVLTGAGDALTKNDVLSIGACEFHVKGGDPAPVIEDILLYLGREIRVSTSLLEVVDTDELAREMDVRYRTPEGSILRCTLDFQLAPRMTLVPGGSFWFDIHKRFKEGRVILEASCRPVDKAEDARSLRELLGDEP